MIKIVADNPVGFLTNIKFSVPAVFIIAGNAEKSSGMFCGMKLQQVIQIRLVLLVADNIFL